MGSPNMIDWEAEMCAWLTQEIQDELAREIFTDIDNIAETKRHQWRGQEHFFDYLRIAGSKVARDIGSPANWILVGPKFKDVFDTMEQNDDPAFVPFQRPLWQEIGSVRFLGTFEKWRVYYDSKRNDDVLMGYKGDQYHSGYFHCPFVPFTETPITNIDQKRWAMWTRYDKKLVNSKFFLRIVVEDSNSGRIKA
jgi:hypothetical protein